LIEVRNLTKRYGSFVAVNNVSFTVNDGEILGFLGPNGAGKTTTMNIITGYMSATSGDCIVNGFDILAEPEKAKKNIGYLPENPPLYGEMTVLEYLRFVADIKGVGKDARERAIEDIMETVRITEMEQRLAKNLSKGYRQRLGLAQAMLGNPDVMILDEPTIGLDPKQIIEMREVIKKLSKKHTVILSSHILQEVSAMCDRVIIIHRGRIVASDTTSKLSLKLSQGHKMLVRVKGELGKIIETLGQISVVREVRSEGSREPGSYDVTVTGDENTDIREAIFNVLAKKELPILLMRSLELTLEEIFLQVTTGEGVAVDQEADEGGDGGDRFSDEDFEEDEEEADEEDDDEEEDEAEGGDSE